jgi:Family of unknown function (DUF6893)
MTTNKSEEEGVQSEEQEHKPEGTRHPWRRVFGIVGLALAATALIANLHDIKRYIRISTM